MPDDRRQFFQTIIDGAAWNRAGWTATMLAHDPSGENQPFMGFIFRDQAAGKQIFTDLVKRIGRADEHGELRLSVVEGDLPGAGPGYTVHFGGNAEAAVLRAKAEGVEIAAKDVAALGRRNRVKPAPGSKNLEEFKAQCEKHGSCLLLPVFGKPGQLEPSLDLFVKKTGVLFRSAAEIDPASADPDAVIVRGAGKG